MRFNCRIENVYPTGTQKKIDLDYFNANGFCGHCNTVLEALGCSGSYSLCQEARPAITEEDIQGGTRRREMDELRKQNFEEKSYAVDEMWEYEWWRLFKTYM